MSEQTPWWMADDDDAADELTDAQLQEIHKDLLALRDSITEQLEGPSDSADTVDLDQPIGRLSRMDSMQQQKMAQAQVGRLKARLSQVSLALRAYDEEEFGVCRSCGESVGYARLKARPETPLCLTCASEIEARRG